MTTYSRQQTSTDIAQLRAVMLPRYGEGHILGPGQLVPIWDIDRLNRTEVPFELQGCFATVHKGALVCQAEPQMMTDIEAIRSLLEQGLMGIDLGQRRNLELAKRSVLGGVGGLCTIRPDVYPIGMVPFAGKEALDGPCMEIQTISALEFHTATHDCPRTTETPPEICFYVAASDGNISGWDVHRRAYVKVVSLPELPCSFMTAQELKLTRPDDTTGDYLRSTMRSEVYQLLTSRGLTKGLIYAGFNMGATARQERIWETGDIGNGLDLPMYILPYVDDPLISLNPTVLGKVQAMIRGEFSRPAAGRVGILGR